MRKRGLHSGEAASTCMSMIAIPMLRVAARNKVRTPLPCNHSGSQGGLVGRCTQGGSTAGPIQAVVAAGAGLRLSIQVS
jgi:hypothetical protein